MPIGIGAGSDPDQGARSDEEEDLEGVPIPETEEPPLWGYSDPDGLAGPGVDAWEVDQEGAGPVSELPGEPDADALEPTE